MLLIDSNSLLIHSELNEDITDLEDEKDYYKNEIEKDKKAIKELSTEDGIEKMAREKYYMKKENEDIYIIEYEDSLKLKKKDE
jgi:cell division protein FtsB